MVIRVKATCLKMPMSTVRVIINNKKWTKLERLHKKQSFKHNCWWITRRSKILGVIKSTEKNTIPSVKNMVGVLWCCGDVFPPEALETLLCTRHRGLYEVPRHCKMESGCLCQESKTGFFQQDVDPEHISKSSFCYGNLRPLTLKPLWWAEEKSAKETAREPRRSREIL